MTDHEPDDETGNAKLDAAVREVLEQAYPGDMVTEWVLVAVTVPLEVQRDGRTYSYRLRQREGMLEHHTRGLLVRAEEMVAEDAAADTTEE